MANRPTVIDGPLDLEKGPVTAIPQEHVTGDIGPTTVEHDGADAESTISESRLSLLARRLESMIGVEARGIHRVRDDERSAATTLTFWQIVALWLSINTAAQNITLGMIGAGVYGLGFVDAACCAVFGALVGSVPAAYTATWGPISGNRTMVFARYTMGWWPVKLCVLLNLVILLGYAMIDAVVAGQILSAVSPDGSLSVVVGIIIVGIITFVVTTFGIKIFHYYERYAFIPQWAVLLLLFGCAGPKFDTTTTSHGDDATIRGNRLSFFSICLSAAITYSPGAADIFVYCDPKLYSHYRFRVFGATLLGLALSFSLTFMLGVGLASGAANDPVWEAAGVGSGALIVAGYDAVGNFGKFCSVVVALGLIANMILPTYSSGIDFQILGRYPAMIPRFIWNTFGIVVFTVCALAGRDSLAVIFTNFLALMGYWVAIWIAITLEEQLIFRRRSGYIWQDWNRPGKLPIGIAASVAFLVGWAGAILCMAQYYYIGPLAALVGDYGADMGNYVGFAWAGLVYPPLRYLELKKFGR